MSEVPEAQREAEPSTVVASAIEGRVALTEQDFLAAWRFLPQMRSAAAVSILTVLLVPVLAGVTALRTGGSGWAYLLAAPICGGALAFGLVRGRARWARSALETLRGEGGVLFRFDEHGFFLKSPGRESQLAWGTLYRCIETDLAFLIYTGPQAVAVVPKRAFAPAEQARLQALLRERIRPAPLAGVMRPARPLLLWAVLVLAFLAIWQFLSPK